MMMPTAATSRSLDYYFTHIAIEMIIERALAANRSNENVTS